MLDVQLASPSTRFSKIISPPTFRMEHEYLYQFGSYSNIAVLLVPSTIPPPKGIIITFIFHVTIERFITCQEFSPGNQQN